MYQEEEAKMPPTRLIYVSLGGNVGNTVETFQKAANMLGQQGLPDIRESALYATAPVGGIAQPDFLNAVVEIETKLPPSAILALLLQTETQLGRDRSQELRWGPRRIDLDYLLDDAFDILETPEVILPHPRMWVRAFVMAPLADLVPDRPGPDNKTVARIVEELMRSQRLTRVSDSFLNA